MKYLKKFNESDISPKKIKALPSDVMDFLKQKVNDFEDEYDIKCFVFNLEIDYHQPPRIVVDDRSRGNIHDKSFILTPQMRGHLQSMIDYMESEGFKPSRINITYSNLEEGMPLYSPAMKTLDEIKCHLPILSLRISF